MKHCLVIDDSEVIRKVGRRIFEDLGFETSEAMDASSAIERCREDMPDAILLDCDIPDQGGAEFLRALRVTKAGRVPVVLYLMTENNVAQITEALDAGATDFLMKPIDRDSVAAKLDELGSNEQEGTA